MKIEQVSKNSYRVRKMVNGKPYTLYFDHRPTQKEIVVAMSETLQSPLNGENKGCFELYCDKYIDSKRNILSPSTISCYQKLKNYVSDDFKKKKLHEIDQLAIQCEINDFAVGHSPKYVRNLHGFISAVLKTFRPTMQISTALPQNKKYNHNLPTSEGVKLILKASEGSPYHIAFQLAALGLRRSEICALTVDDIKGNVLSINKSVVYDENYNLIEKDHNKTTESTREIYLPDSLVAEIKKKGVIFEYKPNALTRALHKYQDALGLERFRLHDFRGYFASYAHSIGIPDEYIIKMGGWKTDHVMKSVYRDALKEKNEEMQRKISDSIFG